VLGKLDLEPPAAGDGSGLDGWPPELLVGLEPGQKTCHTANQHQGGYQDDPFLLIHVAAASRARLAGTTQ
jgi:hypothetical protein